MLKTQLAVFFRTQKSALRDGLNITGKNSLMLFTVTSDLSKKALHKSVVKIHFTK
ncbi:hypothetical protein HMPREF0765_1951 [Sphingobacterium spiritivorum ATCC 33300]|uniref:Uncharacterized protein n=1 Tax=Sphingobacterium spiritivorum ATCC 33300 TaxID=525372 RepID=C2FX95_SPHSI|nr:hypothetical protein HMPREF0765_1951 [Sphingobacterium spiritivorum ATCC 33300]